MTILKGIAKDSDGGELPPIDISAVKGAMENAANQYKLFKRGHDLIVCLESWNNTAKELRQQVDNLASEQTRKQVELADAKAQLAMVYKEIDDVRSLAKSDAENIIECAKSDAARIASEAMAQLATDKSVIVAEIARLKVANAALAEENSTLEGTNSALKASIDSIRKTLGS